MEGREQIYDWEKDAMGKLGDLLALSSLIACTYVDADDVEGGEEGREETLPR